MAGPKNKRIKTKVDTAKTSLQKESHAGASSSYPLNQYFNRLNVLDNNPTSFTTFYDGALIALLYWLYGLNPKSVKDYPKEHKKRSCIHPR